MVRAGKASLSTDAKVGEIFYEEAYISPIKDDAGKISHYVAVKLDVTKKNWQNVHCVNPIKKWIRCCNP